MKRIERRIARPQIAQSLIAQSQIVNRPADGSTPPPEGEPYASANALFHSTYARLVEQQLARLGDDLAVIVLIGDRATLLSDGLQQVETFIPERYHELKALGHLVFGVQLALMANGEGPLAPATERHLREMQRRILGVRAAVDRWAWSPDELRASTGLLGRARLLISSVLEERRVDFERLREPVRAFAGPCLEIARSAARLELARLDGIVSRWRDRLGAARWARLSVVICGSHQPRYREATSQYFARLLGEEQGSAAEREDRILFGEGLVDVDSALRLLAVHRVDQEASQMLFGDPRRLQEDLLADAAAAAVDELLSGRD